MCRPRKNEKISLEHEKRKARKMPFCYYCCYRYKNNEPEFIQQFGNQETRKRNNLAKKEIEN